MNTYNLLLIFTPDDDFYDEVIISNEEEFLKYFAKESFNHWVYKTYRDNGGDKAKIVKIDGIKGYHYGISNSTRHSIFGTEDCLIADFKTNNKDDNFLIINHLVKRKQTYLDEITYGIRY